MIHYQSPFVDKKAAPVARRISEAGQEMVMDEGGAAAAAAVPYAEVVPSVVKAHPVAASFGNAVHIAVAWGFGTETASPSSGNFLLVAGEVVVVVPTVVV